MTDRIQQMLDSVKTNLGASVPKPKVWRVQSILRARGRTDVANEARDGILEKPSTYNDLSRKVGLSSEVDVTYFGPSRPDMWKGTDLQTASVRQAKTGKGLKIDAAEAAIAALQTAKLQPRDRLDNIDPLSRTFGDYQSKLDDADPKTRRQARRGPRKSTDLNISDMSGRVTFSEAQDRVIPPKRRGSWLRVLRKGQ